MGIGVIDHIAINVSDLERSKRFYGDVLGFRELQTLRYEAFSITYFSLPSGARLELFCRSEPGNNAIRPDDSIGLRHIAFQVEEVAAWERELSGEGVPVKLKTSELPELGARVMLFEDPDGVTIEFCNRL